MANANVPNDLRYTKDHEWARKEADGHVRVGITAFAVEQLGDITLVNLPEVGASLAAGKEFGTVESVKTLSDLFAPIGGKVVAVNDALVNSPELVNEGAYDKGWMVLIAPADPSSLDNLMDAAAYRVHLAASEH